MTETKFDYTIRDTILSAANACGMGGLVIGFGGDRQAVAIGETLLVFDAAGQPTKSMGDLSVLDFMRLSQAFEEHKLRHQMRGNDD